MGRVRLGSVGFLNARPLVYGLERSSRFEVRFDVPSRCAELLHAGDIDLGLIPTIEYLKAPRPYAIVPDLAITSRGSVASVAIFTNRSIKDVRTIAIDTSSRTSVALLRILCKREFGIDPELVPQVPDLASMLAACDAALLIGDAALFADPQIPRIDLGEVWSSATGCPFVYAFWAGPEGAVTSEDVRELQAAREGGVTHPEEVARAYYLDDPVRQAVATRYLIDNIQYYLGDDELEGLRLFYRYAVEAGVVESTGELRFFPG